MVRRGLGADVLAAWAVREAVAVVAEPDFSAEEAIEKSKIADRERNPDQPPDQADVQAVGAGLGVLDREAVARIRAAGRRIG